MNVVLLWPNWFCQNPSVAILLGTLPHLAGARLPPGQLVAGHGVMLATVVTWETRETHLSLLAGDPANIPGWVPVAAEE